MKKVFAYSMLSIMLVMSSAAVYASCDAECESLGDRFDRRLLDLNDARRLGLPQQTINHLEWVVAGTFWAYSSCLTECYNQGMP
jgi:hypothetical protein